jgi:hypothetical protein
MVLVSSCDACHGFSQAKGVDGNSSLDAAPDHDGEEDAAAHASNDDGVKDEGGAADGGGQVPLKVPAPATSRPLLFCLPLSFVAHGVSSVRRAWYVGG